MEIHINKSLKSKEEVSKIGLRLATEAIEGKHDKESLVSLSYFLLQTNQIDLIGKLSIGTLKYQKFLAVTPLLIALRQTKKFDESEALPFFITAAEETQQTEQLIQVTNIKSKDLVNLREQVIKKLHEKYNHRKFELLEKINFFKSEKLFDQEKITLQQLEQEFPNHLGIDSLISDCQNRSAAYVLNQQNFKKPWGDFERPLPLTSEEDKLLSLFEKELNLLCKKKPQSSYNFALLFYFLGDLDRSLKMLTHAPDSSSTEWLKLEIMIENRHFVSALELASILESKYAHDPETNFACVYAKARCHWGLNKVNSAINLISNLVLVRADYRSAQTLLSKWNGGL